jgi:hypothetical protein
MLSSLNLKVAQVRRSLNPQGELTDQVLNLLTRTKKIGWCSWNLQTNQIILDSSLEELYGLEFGEFDRRYETFINYLHPDDRDQCDRIIRSAIFNRTDFQVEYRVVFENNMTRWFRLEAGYCSFEPLILIVEDVTEKMQLIERVQRGAAL